LLPPPGEQRVAHRQIEALADGVCDAVVLLVLEAARGAPSADWNARQMKKVEAGCAALEAALPRSDGPTDAWYVGHRFGLADIATGCALAYLDLRLPQFDWRARHPRLAALSVRLEARPAFAATRPQAQEIPAQ
jgi:glutathione S-transferase